MNLERQYIHQFINESRKFEDQFLDQKLPSRSGKSVLTRKDYPMTFKIIDFLDANGYDIQECMKAFAMNQRAVDYTFNFDYNRERKFIDSNGDFINFEWIEEHPEEAIERLWQKNQDVFDEDYSSFNEFKLALSAKNKSLANIYTIKSKETMPYDGSSNTEELKEPMYREIFAVLKKLQPKYGFPVTRNTLTSEDLVISNGAESELRPIFRFTAFLKSGKRDLFQEIENDLEQNLPEYTIINTGHSSHYLH